MGASYPGLGKVRQFLLVGLGQVAIADRGPKCGRDAEVVQNEGQC